MVVSLAQGLLAFFGSSLGLFLLGFGATFVGLVPSSFLRARVSGYCCNVCVGHYTCSEFYLSSVWGVLISFWSVLVFFSHPPPPFYYFFYIIIILFVITVIIISTELLALCDGCSGWG